MPELPDVMLYQSCLTRQLVDRTLKASIIRSPFVLRTWEIDIATLTNVQIVGIERLGKRLIWCFEQDMFLVFHLMIAGRFHWKKPSAMPTGKNDLAAFQFEHGTMMFTEASSKKRAGLWVVRGRAGVDALHTPGLDLLSCSLAQFSATIVQKNNTLKRALADPSRFDGVGNAYSDEILFAAKLSPLQRSHHLSELEIERLWIACRETLQWWVQHLQAEHQNDFPERVTAFRPEMAVHGQFGKKCSKCAAPIQRIRYADNECNYCPGCQTEGRILADRSLSRLLNDDWPKTLEELE
jgi:formamidopyrimidine-DNA glycosylase